MPPMARSLRTSGSLSVAASTREPPLVSWIPSMARNRACSSSFRSPQKPLSPSGSSGSATLARSASIWALAASASAPLPASRRLIASFTASQIICSLVPAPATATLTILTSRFGSEAVTSRSTRA